MMANMEEGSTGTGGIEVEMTGMAPRQHIGDMGGDGADEVVSSISSGMVSASWGASSGTDESSFQHTPLDDDDDDNGDGQQSIALPPSSPFLNNPARSPVAPVPDLQTSHGRAVELPLELRLSSTPSLPPAEFEKRWGLIGDAFSLSWNANFKTGATSDDVITQLMKIASIFCLASGTVEQTLKFYFYAEEEETKQYFFAEMGVSLSTGDGTIVLKWDEGMDPRLPPIFVRLFQGGSYSIIIMLARGGGGGD
jgi:hypothetical protein